MAAIEGVDVIDMTFDCDDFVLLLCFSNEVGLGLRTFSRESRAPPTPLLPPDDPALFRGISEFCSSILLGI